jgi:hypothetical protein
MKNTILPALIAVACLTGTTSCKIMKRPDLIVNTQPYVKLKSGEKFEGDNVDKPNLSMFRKQVIKLDDTSFRLKDVAFYSTGSRNFVNVGGGEFATQIDAGKINVFRLVNVSTKYDPDRIGNNKFSTQKNLHYYIQENGKEEVGKLTYRYLKPMVHPNTPEFVMLKKYQNRRIARKVTGYAGLGLIVGAIMMSGNPGSVAEACFVSGAVVSTSWFVLGWGVGKRKWNVVDAANGTKRK